MIGTPSLHVHGDGYQTWLRTHTRAAPSMAPVALLHGWTLSADEQWHALYPWLAERTSFAALDHPGHGRSDPPRHPFTLSDAAHRTAAVLSARFDEPVVLVGFSLGGPVALHVAAHFPGLVSGLVLASTSHHFPRSRVIHIAAPLIETVTRSRFGDWMRRSETRNGRLPPSIAHARPRLHPQTVAAAARCLGGIDLSLMCQGISVPTSVVVTSTDRMIPPQRQRDLATVMNASVVEVDGPHTIYESNPAAFANAVGQGIDHVAGTLRRLASDRLSDDSASAP
jgi:pimeloyl-ACP methyl ester carboxylesterase